MYDIVKMPIKLYFCFLILHKYKIKISASADGTCKVWNLKTMDCVTTFRVAGDVPLNSVHPIPKTDQFVVCNRSNTIYIVNIQGQVVFVNNLHVLL